MKNNKLFDKERLEHVLHAIRLIESFTINITLENFTDDEKTTSACLFQYAVIAEAINRLDPATLEKYNYPWHKVRSFRNFILHEYHAIEMRVIWDTTKEILPELKKHILEIINNEF